MAAALVACSTSAPLADALQHSATGPDAAGPAERTPLHPDAAWAHDSATAPEFVGSAACLECHSKQARWRESWHARALSKPGKRTLVASFTGAHFHGESSEAWMKTETGRPVMRTLGADGATADFGVDWLVGGKHMQDTISVFPDGRWQILPVYYHVTTHTWVDYTEAKQGALTPEHPFFWTNFRRAANRECLDCHTTGLRVHYDESTARFDTDFADAGVACEACHGPGGKHRASQEAADIVNPKTAAPEIGLALCGSCHGPRNPLYPILDATHRFQPGSRYDDSYQALVLVDGRERSGDFFADGRPKTSSFEYQALLQSRCARIGGATCLSCHGAPHNTNRPNELRAAADETCRACHAPLFAQGQAHTKHAKVGCVDCHMPKIITGVLDRFADHALDVPTPENSVTHQVPNACNACHEHEHEPAAETARALQRLWPTAAARQARRIRLAEAIDEASAASSAPALRAVLADEEEAPTLRGAAAVLFAQRFRSSAEELRPLLTHRAPLLRARALEALGYAHATELAEPIARATRDPVLSVRYMAVLALGMLGDPRARSEAERLVAEPAAAPLPQLHFIIGLIAGRGGDFDTAARELARTVALMPYHTDARIGLADLALRRGDRDTARHELLRLLSFAPDHRAAKSRLARLETK